MKHPRSSISPTPGRYFAPSTPSVGHPPPPPQSNHPARGQLQDHTCHRDTTLIAVNFYPRRSLSLRMLAWGRTSRCSDPESIAPGRLKRSGRSLDTSARSHGFRWGVQAVIIPLARWGEREVFKDPGRRWICGRQTVVMGARERAGYSF